MGSEKVQSVRTSANALEKRGRIPRAVHWRRSEIWLNKHVTAAMIANAQMAPGRRQRSTQAEAALGPVCTSSYRLDCINSARERFSACGRGRTPIDLHEKVCRPQAWSVAVEIGRKSVVAVKATNRWRQSSLWGIYLTRVMAPASAW